jgi:uncharacterized protein YjaZ
MSCASITIYHPINSYINKINTTSYSQKDIKKVLDNFNKMGDNVIVTYSGYRPINISEAKVVEDGDKRSALGTASSNMYSCNIVIQSSMPPKKMRSVLLHEYLHCMNFRHVESLGDLMSAYLDKFPSEKNIKGYAQKLKRLLYGNSR